MPGEKEWEKAARGTDGRLYPWGNARPGPRLANFAMHTGTTTAVGQFSPAGDSPFGLTDAAGNVWEWTASSAEGGEDSQTRIARGGAWPSDERNLRVTWRAQVDPALRFDTVGFRVFARPGDAGL